MTVLVGIIVAEGILEVCLDGSVLQEALQSQFDRGFKWC